MASLSLIEKDNPEATHREHGLMAAGLPAEVAFPYGVPRPGKYRIIVQMKRGGTIETGIFDAQAEN